MFPIIGWSGDTAEGSEDKRLMRTPTAERNVETLHATSLNKHITNTKYTSMDSEENTCNSSEPRV